MWRENYLHRGGLIRRSLASSDRRSVEYTADFIAIAQYYYTWDM